MTTPSLGERVRSLLAAAEAEVGIIAPFIKVGALESLLAVVPPAIHVRCVTTWLPRDIAAGVSDPEIIDVLEDRGHFALSLADNLHAKLYIADHECFAGSPNVTRSGLGDANEGNNIEVLVKTTTADPGVTATLAEVAEAEHPATRAAAVAARTLANSLGPLQPAVRDISGLWFPRSRKPETAYRYYSAPPSGYLVAADRTLLADVAGANIHSGLDDSSFKEAVRSLLSRIPLAEQLLSSNDDVTLTRADAQPYLESIAGDEFTSDDLWHAFVYWMALFFADQVMKQEITELALRRARVIG